MVVGVGDLGTDMQAVQEDQVVGDALLQTVRDLILTPDPTTAVIKTTAAVVLPDKDFRAATVCDITVKVKTVTKQVVVAVPEVQDILAKMIAIRA
jgi:hypothetical protein